MCLCNVRFLNVMNVLAFSLLAAATGLLATIGLRARKRSLAQQLTPKLSVTFDSVGLVVNDLRLTSVDGVRLLWPDVCRVVAYKRDLFTYDCLCLFVARADGTGVELNEDMAAWESFCAALPRFLPGCTPIEKWFSLVAFPAFATNVTELYAHTAGSENQGVTF